MSGAYAQAAISRLASVTLGKMVQSKREGFADVEREYLRAAHIQPDGRLLGSDGQTMWFAPSELRRLDLRRGDVVVVEGGAGYGRSTHLDRDLEGWGFQNSIVRLRPTLGRAEGRFIDYALQAELAADGIAVATNLATIPHFTAEKIARYRISAPPVQAQTAIADYLDRETAEIDAFIADQEQLIALLEERREAEVATQLATDAYPLRPLKSEAVFVGGGTPDTKQDHYWSGQDGIPWVSISDFSAVGEGRAPSKTVTAAGLNAARLRPSTKPTLLFAMYASVGATALVQPPAVWNQAIVGITPTGANSLDYLHFALRALRPSLKIQFRSNTQDNVNLEQVRNLLIPLPPADLQYRIAKDLQQSLRTSDAAIADARQAIALSKERRAALISAAVTGRMDVTERKGVLV